MVDVKYEKVENVFEAHGIEVPPSEKSDNEENPLVVAHFFSKVVIEGCPRPLDAHWFVIGGEQIELACGENEYMRDWHLFGLANIVCKELGYFTLSQILNLGAELDENWTPKGVYDIYEDFDLRR